MDNISLPVAVHVFLIKDQQLLLMKRANTGFNDGKWSVPAGRLNSDEAISQAAAREAKEEVNADIKVSNLGNPLVMHHQNEKGTRLYFFFRCQVWSGELVNMESQACSEIKWFDFNNLPADLIPHVKDAWDNIQQDKNYLEYGF